MIRSRPALLPAAGILCGCLFSMQLGNTAVMVLAALMALAAFTFLISHRFRLRGLSSKPAGRGQDRPAGWETPAATPVRVQALLFAVCLLAGALRTSQTQAELERIRQTYPAGSECDLTGRIVSLEEKNGQTICLVKVHSENCGVSFQVRVDADQGMILSQDMIPEQGVIPARDKDEDGNTAKLENEYGFQKRLSQGHIGQQIFIRGTVREDRIARNEGSFDARRYDESSGIALRIKASDISFGRCASVEWREALRRMHDRITDVYARYLPGEESGLLSGLVLGDRAAMDPEAKQLLSDAGLAHVLAVSGTHVGILGRRTYGRLKRLRLSRILSGLLSGGLLIFYCLLCGSSISALRATVMFLIYLTAEAAGESYDAASAAALCASAFLLIRPQVLYSAGFLLSFGAAFGICFFCEPLQKQLRKKECPMIFQSILFAGAIQVSMLPLTLQLFYEIPIYASLVNLLVLPLVSPLLAAGLWGGILGAGCMAAFGSIPQVADLLLRGLFFLCHCILYLMEAAAGRSLALPHARFTAGAPGWGLCLVFWVFLYLAIHAKPMVKENKIVRNGRWIYRGACGVLFLFLLLGRKLGETEVVMLDVGQGTGIYLSDGRGTNIMIDGGSTSNTEVGTYTIEPFLAHSGTGGGIDYWLISHTDKDHVSGLIELLKQQYPIGTILMPAAEQEMDQTVIEQIRTLASENGTEVIRMFPKDQLLVKHGREEFSITCLGPPEESSLAGANDNSLTLLMEWDGMRIFFGGDISMESEQTLLSRMDEDMRMKLATVEVYIADHHGSNDSSGEALLTALKPQMALISCGVNNSYGHPGEQTMERLKRFQVNPFITAECGQITLKYKADGIQLRKFLEE